MYAVSFNVKYLTINKSTGKNAHFEFVNEKSRSRIHRFSQPYCQYLKFLVIQCNCIYIAQNHTKGDVTIQGKSANYPFPKNIVLNIIKHYTLLITPILIFAKYGQWTGTYIVAFYSILARVTQSHTHTFTHL